METNIKAMAGAIPALEKGMGGAALLQMPGGDKLHKLVVEVVVAAVVVVVAVVVVII